MASKQDALTRIAEKIEVHESGCWLWTAAIGSTGYGVFWVDGKNENAHRALYKMVVEDVPSHLHLDHLCRVRSCVNPDHLEPVTPAENLFRTRRPTCGQGHSLEGDNLYINPCSGQRVCRACQAQWQEAYRERKKARAS